MQPYKPIVMALALSTLLTLPTLAVEWPKPILPPKVSTPAVVSSSNNSRPNPNTAPDKSTTPTQVTGTATTPSLTALSGADSRRLLLLPSMIANMQKGPLTPRKAWDEKLIDVDDLIWLLGSYIQPWGGFDGKIDAGLRRELAALLVTHGDDKLQSLEKLRPELRLWLADYYMSIGDEMCLVLGESILREVKIPVGDEEPLAFQTIERMGRYYAAHAEPEKAVQIWLHMKDYYAAKNRFIPDSLVEAARIYSWTGQNQKANLLYSQVHQYGVSRLTSIVILDQARMQLREGHTVSARGLLQQEITRCEESIKPTMLALLGKCYYQERDFAKARQVCLEAIGQFKKTQNQTNSLSLDSLINTAEARAKWSEQWAKSPLYCQPTELNIIIPLDKPSITRTLSVRSQYSIPISVVCDNPHVIIGVSADVSKSDLFAQRSVTVQINAKGTQFPASEITIGSPQFPGTIIKLPVRIEREKSIIVSEPVLFFGSVKVGQIAEKVFRLSSQTPFKIVSTQSDTPIIDMETAKDNDGYSLKVTLTAAEPSRFYNGRIRINTDKPGQEVIEVAYAAHSDKEAITAIK